MAGSLLQDRIALSRSAPRSPARHSLGIARSSPTSDQLQATGASGVEGEGPVRPLATLVCRVRRLRCTLPASVIRESDGTRGFAFETKNSARVPVHELPVLANRRDCGRNSRAQLSRAPVTGRAVMFRSPEARHARRPLILAG
jgi:hypothetical protein